jgi:hypothetical protein
MVTTIPRHEFTKWHWAVYFEMVEMVNVMLCVFSTIFFLSFSKDFFLSFSKDFNMTE